MTPKQERFVAEYLVDLNATQAAIRAGYSPKSARQNSDRLLTNADIAAAVEAGKAKQLKKVGLTGEWVLEELRKVAASDPRKFFEDWGGIKPIHELGDEEAAALSHFEVVKKNLYSGDRKVDTVHRFKLHDKVRALESLAKHFGLLVEKQQVEGELTIKIDKPW